MKQTTRPQRLALTWLLLLLITLYTVVIPRGERWYDADGSVCMAAEIVCCIPPATGEAAPVVATIHPGLGNFISDEGCTDCRFVSLNASHRRSDTLLKASPGEETVALPVALYRPSTPAIVLRAGSHATRPPPSFHARIARRTSAPRAPPVS